MDKNEKTAKVLGIVSFVLSILGLVCFFIIVFVQISGLWFSFGCAAFSVTALVLGAVSRKKQKNHNKTTKTTILKDNTLMMKFNQYLAI